MDNYPASMTSSIRQHVYEGGLRYHAFQDGRYAFPNDDVEQNRDDMKHTMTLLLCKGKHFYAPIEKVLKKGGKVLDLGGLVVPFALGDPAFAMCSSPTITVTRIAKTPWPQDHMRLWPCAS